MNKNKVISILEELADCSDSQDVNESASYYCGIQAAITVIKNHENIKELLTYEDLPEYGKFVLVSGIDQKTYGIRRWHVCEMNDLEDGMCFKEKGLFHWLTEDGTEITEVTHWCDTPELPNKK